MNTKLGVDKSKRDGLKWAVIAILLIAGLWANSHFSQVDWPLRLAGWIVLACLMVAITLQTAIGKQIWVFAKDSRAELRKVTWPSRQETIRSTAAVIGLVILMAIILWGIDSFLLWLFGLLVHQRG